MKEAKGKTMASTGNAVASSSTAPASLLNVPDAEADGDTDADGSTSSPVKAEPQEVEVADMLRAPEQEPVSTEPSNAVAPPPNQDVEMAVAESEQASSQPPPVNSEPAMDYNPAMTNAQGEPLMAMMTDEAVADLPTPVPAEPNTNSESQTQESQASGAAAALAIPAEVAAMIAGANSSSSGRHRHSGESSTTQARLKLLREKPEVVSRFLFLVVPILFDVFSASVTVQVRMRCFLGILKATSFLDGPGMEVLYKVCKFLYCLAPRLTIPRMSPLQASSARF